MIRCVRPTEPDVLSTHGAHWTSRWIARRQEDPGARFRWYEHNGQPVNQQILPLLLAMTAEHCAYCDGFPLDTTGCPTIDHFKPSSRFPEDAFSWPNLFPACERCQKGPVGKGDDWSPLLLKPDAPDYNFQKYFRYVAATGHLEPNPQASTEDQERAAYTIETFGLNSGSRPRSRRKFASTYGHFSADDRPYRFVFTPLADTP